MLKDALVALIAEKEFSAISITDIINRSDLNRSTFYAHFSNKDELMSSIIDELITGMINSMQTAANNKQKDGLYQPGQATIQLFTYVEDHANYFKTMLNNQRVPQLSQRLSDTLYAFYLDEIKKFPKQSDQLPMNNGLFACYLTSVVIGFIYHWLIVTDLKYSPEFISQELIKVFTQKATIPYLQPSF